MSLINYISDDFFHHNHDRLAYQSRPNQYSDLIWSLPDIRMSKRLLKDFQIQQHIANDGTFQVQLHVEDFKPEEISVKTVGDSIIIDGNHEERKDNIGLIARHIVRRYQLPIGYKTENVASTLTSDGLLTIKCPKTEAIEGVLVREVKIEPIGPAHVKKDDDIKMEAVKEKTEEIKS